jgi:hypothetical protein
MALAETRCLSSYTPYIPKNPPHSYKCFVCLRLLGLQQSMNYCDNNKAYSTSVLYCTTLQYCTAQSLESWEAKLVACSNTIKPRPVSNPSFLFLLQHFRASTFLAGVSPLTIPTSFHAQTSQFSPWAHSTKRGCARPLDGLPP